jgi:hypothetical protein
MKNTAWVGLFLLAVAALLGLTMYWSVINNKHQVTAPDQAVVTQPESSEDTNTPSTSPSAYHDLISVSTPKDFEIMASPFTVLGQARGGWFFEASFPVKLLDADGKLLGTTSAQAQGDWMTTNFVPFVAQLTFATPTTLTGTLVLEKDNPSGLPENADELRVPVKFNLPSRSVNLYYYDESKDMDINGNVLCSDKGLVAVERDIPVTDTPIRDTLNLLLAGQLTPAERAQGITTQYPLSGLKLNGISLGDKHLTLDIEDPGHATTGGACRVHILWKQIEATAKQFEEVDSVSFTPITLFQP